MQTLQTLLYTLHGEQFCSYRVDKLSLSRTDQLASYLGHHEIYTLNGNYYILLNKCGKGKNLFEEVFFML